MKIQVDDVPTASLYPFFDRVADKIHDVASKGGRALVHCMAGVSRSSTLCIAYLMKYKGKIVYYSSLSVTAYKYISISRKVYKNF